MITIRSILFVSALFATFLAVGMEKAPPSRQSTNSNNFSFVHDSESLRLMLLYHNPVRGTTPATCVNAPPRPGTVAG
jgi:hypothetical protein